MCYRGGVALEPLTILVGDVQLAVVVPTETIYRIIRGAIIYRDKLNAECAGETRLTYGREGRVGLTYRVQADLHG